MGTDSIYERFSNLVGEEYSEKTEFANPRAIVRCWSKHLEFIGFGSDYRSLKFSDKYNAIGSLIMEVPINQFWTDYLYGQHRASARPISVDLPGYKTLWLTVAIKRIRRGLQKYYEISAVHILEVLNWILLWPNPFSAAELQFPKYWFGVGPSSTLCASALAANLMRLQSQDYIANRRDPTQKPPPGVILGTISNIAGYIYSAIPTAILGVLADHKETLWPICVNPSHKDLLDTSKWTGVQWRMQKAYDAFLEVCLANDLQMTAQFFVPGEDEQPFPDHYNLEKPTVVIDFVEKGAPTGFTGTIIDGLFKTGLQMADDTFEWLSFPVLDSEKNYDDYLQHLFGMVPDKPFAVYSTGDYSPIENYEQTTNLPLSSRITAGGKSPDWLNDAIVGSANLALSSIGTFIGLGGMNLGPFESHMKDVLLAFHSLEDDRRALNAGPLRFRESMAENSTTGLSVNTAAGMASQHYKTRDYVSHKITVQNGMPYLVGKHIQLGDPIGVSTENNIVEVDRFDEITYEDSRKVRGKFTLTIGNTDNDREPGVIALGKIRMLGSMLHSILTGG